MFRNDQTLLSGTYSSQGVKYTFNATSKECISGTTSYVKGPDGNSKVDVEFYASLENYIMDFQEDSQMKLNFKKLVLDGRQNEDK